MYIESLIPLLILETFFVVAKIFRFIVIDLLFRLIFSLIQIVNRIMLWFHLLFHTNIREDSKCIWMQFCVCFRSCEYYLLESSLFFFRTKRLFLWGILILTFHVNLKWKSFFDGLSLSLWFLNQNLSCNVIKNGITKTLPKARIISYLFNVSHRLLVRIEYIKIVDD